MLGLSIPSSAYRHLTALAARVNAMFRSSEQGVWYDPSDRATLFQDSAGTTPVTAVEQPVGLILDKSGRGNHAYQSTSTSRPVLKAGYQAPALSVRYDGIDDTFASITFQSDLGSNCTVAYSLDGRGAVIHSGQTIGTSYTPPAQTNNGLIIVNRSLTTSETASVKRYLDQRAGIYSTIDGVNSVIMYTAKGQPCHMVRIPKFNLEDIDPSLGTGIHPAFIVNGVEKDAIYIGQYIGHSQNGEMLSLPGVDPINTINFDDAVSLVRANGAGWHLMSNIEWAALSQWCWKNGFLPRGNTQYGRSSDLTTEIGVRSDGLPVTGADQGSQSRTLTGSGPVSWRHNNTPFGIADLSGNVLEWAPGARLNNGEINIITNNNAALSAADFGVSSAEWKAIDGATGALVAPGTAGTVKYASANSGTADFTLYLASGSSFEGMGNNTGANPVSAAALQLLKQHGMFPIASSGLGGDYFYLNVSGERMPSRGGGWNDAAGAGVFTLGCTGARSGSYANVGARPAFVA